MSFLGSLIARAAGSAQTVQPRLPSRYESDSAPAPPEEIVSEPPAAASPIAPRRQTTLVVERPPSLLRTAAAPPAERIVERESEPPHPASIAEHRIVEQQQQPPPQREQHPAPEERVAHERERAKEIVRELVPPPEERVAHERERAKEIVRELVPPPDAPERAIAAPAIPPRALPPRQDTLRVLLEPRVLHQHTGTHVTSLQGTANVTREVHQDAPTIRVTIGRVDVRATAAPAPQKPATPPRKPPFTLDDYIRLRKEGRR